MARRAGDSTQRPANLALTNGSVPNGAPPPSTIAAQIVHNHSNINAQQEPTTKAVFGQLLQEYLIDPSNDEPNSQLNAELITVVAEAGLDVLVRENLFAPDLLVPQAIDSISVIKLTIQRRPELLLSTKRSEGNSVVHPKLFLRLLPKILPLMGHCQLDAIQEHLQDLLLSCVQVLQRTSDLWQHAVSLIQLYRSCVDDILRALEASFSRQSSSCPAFAITLPPSNGINDAWPESQHLVALPQGAQITVSSPSQATIIAFSLTSIIAAADAKILRSTLTHSWHDNTLQGALDSCARLWLLRARWTKGNEQKSPKIDIAYLQSLEAVSIRQVPASGYPYLASDNAAASLSYGLSDVLKSYRGASFDGTLQGKLTWTLVRLRSLLDQPQEEAARVSWQPDGPKKIVNEILNPVLIQICQKSGIVSDLTRDFQVAVCLFVPPDEWPNEQDAIRKHIMSTEPVFDDIDLELEASSLLRAYREAALHEADRPQKRPRLQATEDGNVSRGLYESFVDEISTQLGSGNSSLVGLHNSAVDHYLVLPEDKRNVLFSANCLANIACAGAHSLEATKSNSGHLDCFSCRVCDDTSSEGLTNPRPYWNGGNHGDDWKEVISTLAALIETPEFLRSTKPRILMALTIRRVFNHISDGEYLDLDLSSLGQWCLRSLRSTLRELRIVAGRALTAFLRQGVPKEVKRKNRLTALNFYRTLAERNDLPIQETLILAYGRAARVCGEDELNIILIHLVEYLNHSNPLLCGVAYNELSSLADSFNQKPTDMLRPFWRSIGPTVIKDLQTRPQKAQQLSELLGMSVNQMLLMTQTETLPYLVLTKKKDVLQRIASARGTSIQDVCTQPRKNLAAILALLLRQQSPDVEKSAMDTLVEIAPAFQENDNDLSSWIKLEPILVACELLKAAAEEDESKKPQVHLAFQSLAMLAGGKTGSKTATKKAKALVLFFESHVLGIMAHFSEVLDAPHETHPVQERRRCVGAIEEMINLAKGHVNIALPQIRACLQSAMGDKQLSDQTFSVWAALLTVVDEEDIESLIDQTFAIIAQNWNFFGEESQMKAYDTVGNLIKTHSTLLRDRIDCVPSLASIPLMSKYDAEINRFKSKVELGNHFDTFSQRCRDENAVVVTRALEELIPFLEANQIFLHESAISQKPTRVLSQLTRSILDACNRFTEEHFDITILCARCLGLIGCLDPHRVEAVREKREILVLSNFERAIEVVDFTAFLLERILVKVFHSATNARVQGFLAYVMQELLKFCGFNEIATHRPRSSQPTPTYRRWVEIPESVRSTLTPFLSSRYMIRSNLPQTPALQTYPLFTEDSNHADWLRTFVFDLLQRGKGDNAKMIFPVLARIIRGHDLSIASFILPFAALNVIVGGTDQETSDVSQELLTVLKTEIVEGDHAGAENIKQCSENVFQVLDYLSRWLQEKRKAMAEARSMAGRTGRGINEDDEMKDISQISSVERILQGIPAEVISRRAVECGSYARALFHWEQYTRQQRERAERSKNIFQQAAYFEHLQYIYAQIDEPDSIEGISAHLHVLDPDQQVLEHRKAGRWTAAQSWYELALAEKPNDPDIQVNLLTCLKESGQYDSLLNYVEGFHTSSNTRTPKALPFAAEAAWVTGKWQNLERILASPSEELSQVSQEFDVGIGRALLALRRKDQADFMKTIAAVRENVARGFSPTSTASIQACHDHLLRLHVLYEIETIGGISSSAPDKKDIILAKMDRRLDILGSYTSEKQYLLGIRRAAMQLSHLSFTKLDVASAWLTSARLARKANFTTTAYNSVLHAAQLGDDAAKIEHSRLLWKDGHHRKAIQNLEGAIASKAFESQNSGPIDNSVNISADQLQSENKLTARAHLLLAKWLDRAGQTMSYDLREKYQTGIRAFPRWDKGHYYLGRHYNKILESEKLLPRSKQSFTFLAGELNKLVIDNYIRSMVYGTKYYYQMVPKVLTLWLDLGMEVEMAAQRASAELEIAAQRVRCLENIHKHLRKYMVDRVPAYAWYTAFPQIITRISHPNKSVYDVLSALIIKVAAKYPQQALWSLLAVPKATASDRASRGVQVLQKLKDFKRTKSDSPFPDLKALIMNGQRLSEALLAACEVPVETRATHVSLTQDLRFNPKLAPCLLVVPIEATMIAALPAGDGTKTIRAHNPFPHDAITIASFQDDVLVLSSLQRPRKLTVRGSDGRQYGLLCKPKDDLRKDQRLMEFNAMINRALKRDIESSKRRLYIKTYGVTPLNEECGTIEWVEGLKPMRDIILRLYRQKNVPIDYGELKTLLAEACLEPSKVNIFTERIIKKFPPVLYEWFIETFPEPEAWLAARIRYTRSCAVMSIIGHILGLGDRHGENVLLEEGNGGVFHVDFNCLFDKGLTFEKPELVPFRLTHNMVDAMGPSSIEGPFRTAAELTYQQLRQHEDTLITILETFVHDPTADFLGGKRKKRIEGVPDSPKEVLEAVRGKVGGLLRGESVPLSVEGYVEALIAMAMDPRNLAAMYIGWCAFF
ncbi:protein kinase rad3 [Mytilinidion resinicola]|uniref:Serine/threonine-protein kinase MEC1 n=1 Tax=Mytilinidion resinicola TaxID=574789 RepID=A0A6A6Z178_9PEZI|nr:protein kinase rad3 [Mytilinidion resinicola]KAF2813925.1 protein kinase rad3 [Mytilinidion resinicola]